MSYFGKYRGLVTDVKDPLNLGRLKARVPDVLGGNECGWALPCLPFAGQSMGFFAMPTVGAGVWIEFEHGDPEYPIWSGCFYNVMSEVPPNAIVPPMPKALIRTAAGNSLLLDDRAVGGGIQLKTLTGEILKLSSNGLELYNPAGMKIFSVGPEGIEFTDLTGKKVFSAGPDGLEFAGLAGQQITCKKAELLLKLAVGAKLNMEGSTVSVDSGAGATIDMKINKVSINGTALEVM